MRQVIAAVAFLIALSGVVNLMQWEPPQQVVNVPLSLKYTKLHTFTQKDLDCLAENVYHEARGESIDGQMAVAQVTINRYERKHTMSLCQVVYQHNDNGCQFSWTCDPAVKRPRRATEAWRRAVSIARRMALGEICCIGLENAIYYHSVQVKPLWAKSKIRITKIGQHIFYAEA